MNFGIITASGTIRLSKETSTLSLNIVTPSEGEEITGDVNIAWDILNTTAINIKTPTEGEEITGDVNITFELI